MKRVSALIGVSALFFRHDAAAASPEFNKPWTSISLPFDTWGDLETSQEESSRDKMEASKSLIQSPSSQDPLDVVKPEKRAKKETAQKKNPTTSKTSSSSGSTSTSPSKSSATLRRIKKEYEDAVNMGICYDWAKQKLVKKKKDAIVNQEYQQLICVGPLVSNLRHWHFSFRGCGIYEHGIYHGLIILPKDYPATPPRVQLWTPSGRFVPQHDICLSASSYHPESWTPRWTILSLIQALRLHMLTNPQEIGGKLSSLNETLDYAKASLKWWAKFDTGKSRIEVNHDLLLQQGVLSLLESDGEKIVDKSKDATPVEEAKTETEAIEDSELEKDRSPQTFEPKPPKISKSKKNRKTKKKGEGGTAVILETARINKLSTNNPVLTLLSKAIGSPFRMALFSLLLFFWVVSSDPT